MNELEQALQWFVEDKRIMACLTVTGGTAESACHAACGRIREKEASGEDVPLGEDTLFDLASLTKIFTGMAVLRLREEGLLDLSRPVTAYAPQFAHLGEVSVERVLTFSVGLTSPARIDAQPTREEGLRQLFLTMPQPLGTGRYYSDMHAMVLKYVVEGAAGESLFDCLSRRILRPLGMRNTFAHVPQGERRRAASCDLEHRIEGTRHILRRGIAPGTVHDPKARLLSLEGADLCGHAGLFATRGDMVRFCQGVLRGQVLSRESLRFLAQNRTGRPLPEGGYTQYLGCQCYVKHPDQFFSEIPVYMGEQAFGLSGFTGHHLAIDPERGLFSLFLGDRVLNRLTVLRPPAGMTLTDFGLDAAGFGSLVWDDGRTVFSSVDYVHQKDARLHAPLARMLGVAPREDSGCP